MSNYVETWKGIATALGPFGAVVSLHGARRRDPLPVFKVGGIVRLNDDDLEDWLPRQRERSLTPMPVPVGCPRAGRTAPEMNLKLIA